MEYNEIIRDQLIEYIKQPTVLVNKEDVPYEFKDSGSVNRLKRRRMEDDIPLQLYSFVLSNHVTKNQLREFSSGLFLNYINTTGIYA